MDSFYDIYITMKDILSIPFSKTIIRQTTTKQYTDNGCIKQKTFRVYNARDRT